MSQNQLRFNLTTYSQFSHNYLIAVLSSKDIPYTYESLMTEESFSRFTVVSTMETFKTIKELIESDNNGTAVSIEYGTY